MLGAGLAGDVIFDESPSMFISDRFGDAGAEQHLGPLELAVDARYTEQHKVRKTPSWAKSWANFSLLSLCFHRNA